MDKLTNFSAKALYATRLLLIPIYFTLSFALLAICVKFFQESIHMILHIFHTKESELVLTILSLIDMTLVGGLIVMVMLTGYANFIAKVDDCMPAWLQKLDAGALKQKVAASIVAISSIHLLQVFMNVEIIEDSKLLYYVVIHMTFVASAYIMSLNSKH